MTLPAAAYVLDVVQFTDGVQAQLVFWLEAPANRVKPIAVVTTQGLYTTMTTTPGGTVFSPNSKVPLATLATPTGATLAELNAVENGFFVEQLYTSPKVANLAALSARIAQDYTAAQSALTASGFPTSNLIGGRYDVGGNFTPPGTVAETFPA